jgi:hypothetical protein
MLRLRPCTGSVRLCGSPPTKAGGNDFLQAHKLVPRFSNISTALDAVMTSNKVNESAGGSPVEQESRAPGTKSSLLALCFLDRSQTARDAFHVSKAPLSIQSRNVHHIRNLGIYCQRRILELPTKSSLEILQKSTTVCICRLLWQHITIRPEALFSPVC